MQSLTFKKNPFHTRIQIKKITRKDGKIYSIRENRDRYFFPDEWKIFFDALKKKQKLTFNFLINTGARINEARNVRVEDVDLERKYIIFRWTKSRNQDGSRKIRSVPISSEFTKYLIKMIKFYDLKPQDKFPILSTPACNIAMEKALKKIGMPDWIMFSVHNIRKTTEMYLLALGVEAEKVAKHMGHSVLIAQKHYTSVEIFNWEDKSEMREIIGDLYRTR